MKTVLRVFPHNMASESAGVLARALAEHTGKRVLRVRRDGNYRMRDSHLVINWGVYGVPQWYSADLADGLVNKWEGVRVAGCKLASLEAMEAAGVSVPLSGGLEWAHNIVARGGAVYARHELRGHGGEGIQVVRDINDLHQNEAALFTQRVETEKEYRIHVINGEVVFQQEKRRDRERNRAGEINYDVRNHEGGWRYCIQDVNITDAVLEEAVLAVAALGLDFGAVDLVVANDIPYILEVNTAPGLCEQTAGIYAEALVRGRLE